MAYMWWLLTWWVSLARGNLPALTLQDKAKQGLLVAGQSNCQLGGLGIDVWTWAPTSRSSSDRWDHFELVETGKTQSIPHAMHSGDG